MKAQIRLEDGSNIPLPSEDSKAAGYLADIIRNSGRVPNTDQKADWTYFADNFLAGRDAVGVTEIRPLLDASIDIIMREPLEPIMNILPLFTPIRAKGLNTMVLAGALGAEAGAQDIGEQQTYPEVNFVVGGGMQTAWIGKSGIAASWTQEALRYSTWDIMSMNLKLMKNAMIRHKENKAALFLRNLGTPVFDNLSPTESVFGVFTGRGLDGSANGSVTMDDLVKAISFGSEQGQLPDILLISPLMYLMWLQDPVMRHMLLAFGGASYWNRWTGNAGPTDPWSNGAMGAMGPSHGQQVSPQGNAAGETPTGIEGRAYGMTSAPTVPPYFPWPFEVRVSPFVPFDVTSGLGDAFLLKRDAVGYYLIDEDLTQVQWTDENLETVKIKFRERYGFGIMNEGQTIQVLKNIPFNSRNYWDGTINAWTSAITDEIASDTDLSAVF